MVDLGLAGRRVLVTGGTSGIGLAVAEAFAGEGAHIGILGRSSQRLSAAVDELRERHPKLTVVGCVCDISVDSAVQSATNDLVSQLGGLDHLVSSAGISGSLGSPVDQVAAEEFMEVQRTNVLGPFLAIKAALPHLREGTGATYTLIGSDSGFVAVPGMLAYNASKGATVQLTRALSTELYNDGIRVNSVCPSIVDTPMAREDLGVDSFDEVEFPVSKPTDVAWLVLSLASPRSSPVNGVSLIADYGYHARSSFPA
ncbi:SDR family NAD(P)-dependent oxidoreductase [Paenarthrobacter nitroguajacolicus]|uniref:SDR family NAD(P)-dependent oxidoreductase n=1 Tax=Paenarthrobacter nitroguajacolicus TaxID=211146 RepID=UPI004053BE3F